MKRILGLLLIVLVLGGCTTAESVTKAAFDMAWKAAETVVREQVPVLSKELLDGAKAYADKAVDEGMALAAKKTADIAHDVFEKSWKETGVDIRTFDRNRDGTITPTEWYQSFEEENARREREGEPPLGVKGIFWLLVGTAAFTSGKSAMRAYKNLKDGKGLM